MTAPPKQSAPADHGGRQGQDASHRQPTPAPAEVQVLIHGFNIDVHGFILMAAEIKELERLHEKARREFMDRQWERVRHDSAKTQAELDAYLERHLQRHRAEVARKKHRQEVADRLAEAQLELALLEIEIRRAELAAIKEGGNP
jgi:hypothetical protein